MKTLRILLALTVCSALTLATFPAKAADSSVSISCVTFKWPESIYRPVSGVLTFQLTYQNNCPYEVLQAKYQLVDKFGTRIAGNSIIGLKSGVTSNQSQTWFASDISDATAPLSLNFIVENFASSGMSNPPETKVPFNFLERTASVPTPTPTVTVSAKPSPAPTVYLQDPANQALADLVSSLKAQVNMLNTKLKKICAVKPKPKGC